MDLNHWEIETIGTPDAWDQALGTIFTLASAARHYPRPTRRSWDVALLSHGLNPPVRKSFWLRLMRSAALIDALPSDGYRPTTLLLEWFHLPAHRQARVLLEAWVQMPAGLRLRQERRRIVRKLALLAQPHQQRRPQSLTPTDLRKISALIRIGIWDEAAGGLTLLGQAALGKTKGDPEPDNSGCPRPAVWNISLFSIQIHQTQWKSQNLSLLWELEAFLQPFAPGRYLLTPPALRQAAQRGSPVDLASVLEQGSGSPLPADLRARILDLPQARLLSGAVLEFDSSEELAQLRRRAALRPRLDALLSPRHVYLPPYAQSQTLAALARAGIPIHAPAALPDEQAQGQSTLAPGEIADLLALARIAQETDLGVGASPELIDKLSAMLPPALLRAAQTRADQAIQARRPKAPFSAPAELGTVPQARIAALQCAADLEQALSVWYCPAGAHRAEHRRITPLLIEQRGQGLYLLAFCHRRRANRTFRLDRLLLEEEYMVQNGPSP